MWVRNPGRTERDVLSLLPLGPQQMTGGVPKSWGLESSRDLFTHLPGTWAGITQRLISAGTVDQRTYGGLGSSQCGHWVLRDSIQLEAFRGRMFQDSQADAAWAVIARPWDSRNITSLCWLKQS